MGQENMESLQNLYENLRELEIDANSIPIVMQYNKRDLPNIMAVDYMNQTINYELQAAHFEAIAIKGQGVFQTLKCIASKTLKKAEENIKNKRKRPKSNITPVHQTNDKTRKMGGTTPSGFQMPGKTKFQLSFKKEGEAASAKPKFQTTFGEKKPKPNLPFAVKKEEEVAENQSETKSITATDKISLRRSSDVISESESIDSVNTNNQNT